MKIEGEIVRDFSEYGRRFRIEKLDPPVRRGAGDRHYRLWEGNFPIRSRQWCYTLEQALSEINYAMYCDYQDRIRYLEQRVSVLESRLAKMGYVHNGKCDL